eukprot:PhM_4_TR717/c0_g3_i1/m.91633/K14721/RPC5, POLR3E; DNA-directed RNA polymerase III subunit RPC5
MSSNGATPRAVVDADDDDPVVQELDVFLSTDISSALHILQFPLRPRERPYNLYDICEARKGMTSQRVTLEFEEPADGKEYLPEDRMEGAEFHRHSVRAAHVVHNADVGMCVGLFRGQELHLNPVTTMQQLRPDLSARNTFELETAEDLVSVTRSVAATTRQRSAFVFEERNEECISLNFVPRDTPEANEKRSLLHSPFLERVAYDGAKESVPRQICPVMPSTDYKPSLSQLGMHSIDRQVHGLCMSAQVVTLPMLRDVIVSPKGSSEEGAALDLAIIRALESCAVYVRGAWVCKVSQRPLSTRLAAAREHVIAMLDDEADGISRAALIASLPEVLSKGVTEVLNILATLDPTTRKWKLKHSVTSTAEPENVVTIQRAAWVKRKAEISENVALLNSAAPSRPVRLTMPWAPPPPDATSGPAAKPRSTPQEMQASNEILAVLRSLFASYGVINGPMLIPMLNREKSRPDSRLRNIQDSQCRECIKNNVCRIGQNGTILKMWGDPAVDEFRSTFADAFREKDSLSRQELLDYIRTKHGDKEVPAAVFKRIVNELADFKNSENKWTLKSGIVG